MFTSLSIDQMSGFSDSWCCVENREQSDVSKSVSSSLCWGTIKLVESASVIFVSDSENSREIKVMGQGVCQSREPALHVLIEKNKITIVRAFSLGTLIYFLLECLNVAFWWRGFRRNQHLPGTETETANTLRTEWNPAPVDVRAIPTGHLFTDFTCKTIAIPEVRQCNPQDLHDAFRVSHAPHLGSSNSLGSALSVSCSTQAGSPFFSRNKFVSLELDTREKVEVSEKLLGMQHVATITPVGSRSLPFVQTQWQ